MRKKKLFLGTRYTVLLNLRVVGTSGPAGIKAGSGISNPVSGSHFSIPEMKQELAGIRNSEFRPYCSIKLALYHKTS